MRTRSFTKFGVIGVVPLLAAIAALGAPRTSVGDRCDVAAVGDVSVVACADRAVASTSADRREGEQCTGVVTIVMQGDPPMPTGAAWLDCESPCPAPGGCAKYTVFFGQQRGEKCGCASDSEAPPCCDVVLSPPNPTGGPLPHGQCGGKCPGSGNCQAVIEFPAGSGPAQGKKRCSGQGQ